MRFRNLLLLLSLCCAFAATAAAQDSATSGGSSPQAGVMNAGGSGVTSPEGAGVKKYLLGPGDVLDLRVYNEPQFNTVLTVNDEGKVEVPFIEQPISAQCRTDREIKADIVKALEKYLKKPQVSFRVIEMKSRPAAVVYGAVRNPTAFDMRRRVRLIELLSRSGSVTEQASGDVQIFHTEEPMCPEPEDLLMLASAKKTDDAVSLPYSVYKIEDVKSGLKESNPVIWPGDIVLVQEARPIYVTGAVVQPSPLYLRQNLTLSLAIAQVGGARKGAKTDTVRIIRKKEGALNPDILIYNLDDIKKKKQPDVALMPYDVIDVSDGNPWSLKNLPLTLLGLGTQGAGNVISGGAMRIIQ
ncbi:MAG TPA: polysaccharide biosynthesis/export family protein [Pyrinomonadaceae bacterium]|jgi:polysaccharide export outer membrane protein|nr:polysaccharide biosynthesis/export family protein [Pyrinomonadaceae bacterium]